MLGQLGLISLGNESNRQEEESSKELEELIPQNSISSFPTTISYNSSNPWDWQVTENTNSVVNIADFVKSSQIGPDGNLYVFGSTYASSNNIHQLKFGSQNISPSGHSKNGYFAVRFDMSSSTWDWQVTENTNSVVNIVDFVKSSQIGPDGNLYVFGSTYASSNNIHQLKFGSQNISPSGHSKNGYFAVKMNMFRGWESAVEAGGGNYSALPSLVTVDRNGNSQLSIVGGNGSGGSNYFQEFPYNNGNNLTNCTQKPYRINYNLSQQSGTSNPWSTCSQTSNLTDMVYVNSTLVTSQAPVLSLAYDHNSGILYQFGMQTNTSSGCPASNLPNATSQPGFCIHGGNTSVIGGGGNTSARAVSATADNNGNIIVLGIQPLSTEENLSIGNLTIPASENSFQGMYLARYNLTSQQFDRYVVTGNGGANASPVKIESMPSGVVVVLGDRPSCSSCSITIGETNLEGSLGYHSYLASFNFDQMNWGWLEFSHGSSAGTSTAMVDLSIDGRSNVYVLGELIVPVGDSAGFPNNMLSNSSGEPRLYHAKLLSGVLDGDGDGILELEDSCPGGDSGWISNSSTDYDNDGCKDATEDDDDDDDSIIDSLDYCQLSSYTGIYSYLGTRIIWTSGSGYVETPWGSYAAYDHDSDGCHDLFEDVDDDNDSILDLDDLCINGALNWTSNQTTDFDNDGCLDSGEDNDDDNDGVTDLLDLCPEGVSNFLNTTNGNFTDNDLDGCEDLLEDIDDDNDGFNDTIDLWPHDVEAYGADTDSDGLPDEIYLTESSFVINRSTLSPNNQSINFGHRDNVSLNSSQGWTIPLEPGNATTPLFIPQRTGQEWDLINGILIFDTVGSGLFSLNYSLDSTNCNLAVTIVGGQGGNSLLSGNNTYNQSLPDGNHSIIITSYENSVTSPYGCREETLKIWSVSLPRVRNVTDDGLAVDDDDDNDGFSDYIETSGICGNVTDSKDAQSSPPDVDGDYICDSYDDDIDGDGYNNSEDAFAYDGNASIDTDDDGMPDQIQGNSTTGLIEDEDDDNDGFNDSIDPWPLDECVGEDHDSDGLADNVQLGCQTTILQDGDDDNDNKLDQDDFCPRGVLNWLSGAVTDNDADGCRDADEDLDDDNDGLLDINDLCPSGYVGWVSNPSVDQDGDGCHDLIEDNDDDNDGVTEPGDICPNTPVNVTVDSQGCPIDSDVDGVPDYLDNCYNTPAGVIVDINGCPIDTDSDGVPDYQDDFPNDANETMDSDGDGVGDNSDAFPNDANETMDSDGDGVGDNSDVFPSDANETIDSDGDGVGDNSDAFPSDANETMDTDGDGVGDNSDAFPSDANETMDTDGDGVGDNSDVFPSDANETIDSDGDGVGDNSDAFPSDANETMDTDGDGVGDNSDAFPSDANETMDTDGDGVGDNSDVFPSDANETIDSDGDGVGDNSDAFPSDASETLDTDGDGVGDNSDVFPSDANETIDSDSDGEGDNSDAFPSDASETLDTDGDGVGDNSDAYPDDASRTVKQESSSLILVLIIAFFCLAGVGFALFKRNSSSEKKIIPLEAPVDSIDEQISEDQNEHVETPEVPKTPESPSITETGVTGDDGFEWLEFPEGSGSYFYRVPGENQWAKWDN